MTTSSNLQLSLISVICVIICVHHSDAFNLSPKPNIIFREPAISGPGFPKMRSSYFGFTISLKRNRLISFQISPYLHDSFSFIARCRFRWKSSDTHGTRMRVTHLSLYESIFETKEDEHKKKLQDTNTCDDITQPSGCLYQYDD